MGLGALLPGDGMHLQAPTARTTCWRLGLGLESGGCDLDSELPRRRPDEPGRAACLPPPTGVDVFLTGKGGCKVR